VTHAQDLATRKAALQRLAIATKERLPEHPEDRAAFYKVFLDDLDKFATETFVEACRRLETRLDWFPKKHELYEECQLVVKHRSDERAQRQLGRSRLLDEPQVDPAKLSDFRHRVRELLDRKAIR